MLVYLLKTETFWNTGAYSSGSSTRTGARWISFFANISALLDDNLQICLWLICDKVLRLLAIDIVIVLDRKKTAGFKIFTCKWDGGVAGGGGGGVAMNSNFSSFLLFLSIWVTSTEEFLMGAAVMCWNCSVLATLRLLLNCIEPFKELCEETVTGCKSSHMGRTKPAIVTMAPTKNSFLQLMESRREQRNRSLIMKKVACCNINFGCLGFNISTLTINQRVILGKKDVEGRRDPKQLICELWELNKVSIDIQSLRTSWRGFVKLSLVSSQ